MEILTPFDFVERYSEGKRVAVVGNAPSTLEYPIGQAIDDFDYIIRFNECTTVGFEEHIGSRTSILIANPYAETRSRRILDGQRAEMVLVIASQTRRGDRKIFSDWLEDHPVLFTYCPDLVTVPDSAHKAGLTTGTYGLQLIQRVLKPSEMLVTGFTMFADEDHSHYWKAGIPGGIHAHDFQGETVIFANMLNTFKCVTYVTPDVRLLLQKSGVSAAGHIRDLAMPEQHR
ncbi:MAG: glycosyltransferase family 29 protein [Bdellovibrionales bacterium]|nr:glycosyltransferase family 29 protein [Bdellovibrionales bacterium]